MSAAASERYIGWFGVFRLGLVQMALGAIVILMTSTLNRVMVVELALPAVLPGALVGWHYAVQMSRPRWGYGADMGGARAPWIVGGMAVLGAGAMMAAFATMLMANAVWMGAVCAFVAFFVIGVGVGAAGTNLLALLAARTAPSRKAAAAAIVWIMMIFGFVLTAGLAGQMLDPFSMTRLVAVTGVVSLIAVLVSAIAVWRMEGAASAAAPAPSEQKTPFA
ncbi:MAG: PucC family protein, partial [Hyphococcus sp.]